jgi:hypothetical protein
MDRLIRGLRPSPGRVRDMVALACALAVVAGVGLLFGLGAALIVGGLVGLAFVAAWSYIVTRPPATGTP